MHLKRVLFLPEKYPSKEVYPFNLDIFRHSNEIVFDSNLTFLVGENGTGKSTHIEQVAARLNWPCVRINLDSHVSRIDLIGKDSIVMTHLAKKAFWPGRIAFPLLHIDTGHNFPETLEFRDRLVDELDARLIVRYVQDSRINAFADGEAVYMMAGMMRFAENDQELALILGHELAHNVEAHISAKKVNATIGLVFDLLAAGAGVNTRGAFSQAGANSYSQDFESEADYVGLYYLARAGIEVDGAAYFWRRMAAEHKPDPVSYKGRCSFVSMKHMPRRQPVNIAFGLL